MPLNTPDNSSGNIESTSYINLIIEKLIGDVSKSCGNCINGDKCDIKDRVLCRGKRSLLKGIKLPKVLPPCDQFTYKTSINIILAKVFDLLK